MLSESDKQKYRMIYKGIEDFESQIKIPKVNSDQLKKIIEAIIYDNPHLYYIDFHFYEYTYSKDYVFLKFKYAYSQIDKVRYQKEVNSRLVKIISDLKIDKSDEYAIALGFHDYMCHNIKYDNDAKRNNSLVAHTVIGALLENCAVCDGFARTFKYLCNLMKIKCIVVLGQGIDRDKEGHAWNIINVNNTPCHVDVTWDANLTSIDKPVRVYFGLDDKSIKNDHVMNDIYPKCISNKMDYMIHYDKLFSSKKELYKYLKQCIIKKYEVIDFKLKIDNTTKSFKNIVIENVGTLLQNNKCTIQFQLIESQCCCRLFVNYH